MSCNFQHHHKNEAFYACTLHLQVYPESECVVLTGIPQARVKFPAKLSPLMPIPRYFTWAQIHNF